MAVDMSEIVVYGIDVGKDSTRWSRLSIDPSFKVQNNNHVHIDVYGLQKNVQGHYLLNNLVEWIYKDMKDGKRVAIGIEAPMWRPESDSAMILTERFPSEIDREFWRGLGAEATGKANAIIRPLLNLINLKRKQDNLSFETTTSKPYWTKDRLLLFEGFVTEKYKPDYESLNTFVKKRLLLTRKGKDVGVKFIKVGKDALDAFVLAFSFWIHHYKRYDILPQLNKNSVVFMPQLFCVTQADELLIDQSGKITYSTLPIKGMVESHFHSASRRFDIVIIPKEDEPCEIYGVKFR